MNRQPKRLSTALRAVRQLGPARAFWYALYQLGLRGGVYRRIKPLPENTPTGQLRLFYHLPEQSALLAVMGDRLPRLMAEAEEICAGQIRLFGAQLAPIQLQPPYASRHWTYYEGRPSTWGVEDIKLLWEPARFGWVYPLGRAYATAQDERCAGAFWQYLEMFQQANPPYRGPNWSSAQEVGLRLLALLFASRVFIKSAHTTPARTEKLKRLLADHAARIMPTLSYARAQNNNHRVVEALALYVAGKSLPDHRLARRWEATGWRELNKALLSQIEADGTYTQHSLNYHRLMLQAALQGLVFGRNYPEKVLTRLAAATRWLLAQIDPTSGRAPNLGSNDGALIFPTADGGYADYRPTAQAAARAFLRKAAFPPGPWDETSLWLQQPLDTQARIEPQPASPAVHRVGSADSWATLRAVRFLSRPSHADQLHVDIWWRGKNIALDAGTFRYTAPAPWDNALARTRVHNTVEVNHQDQMQRAGRFLWLDWAQAVLLPALDINKPSLTAQHDGYKPIGVLHRRCLEQTGSGGWLITDTLLPAPLKSKVENQPAAAYNYSLHWLLPDWPYQIDANRITLEHPKSGRVTLAISLGPLALIRAGELLAGPPPADPVLGWYAPTYNHKVPALSVIAASSGPLPVWFTSTWTLEPPETL